MTDKELKEIEDRANKATSGPWYWHQPKGFGADCVLRSKTDKTYSDYTYIATGMSGFANCDFIAAARGDVPKLIAEIKELRKRLGEPYIEPAPPKNEYADESVSPGDTTRLGDPKDTCS